MNNFVGSVVNSSYYLNYTSIQIDILNHGPVEASFDVYDDFIHYKSGRL